MHLTKKYTKVLLISSALASFGLATSSHAQVESTPIDQISQDTIAFGGNPKPLESKSVDHLPESPNTSPSTSQPEFLRHSSKEKMMAPTVHTTKQSATSHHDVKKVIDHKVITSPSTISDKSISSPYHKPIIDTKDSIESDIRPAPVRQDYLHDDYMNKNTSITTPDTVSTPSNDTIYHKPAIDEYHTPKITDTKTTTTYGMDSINEPKTDSNATSEVKSNLDTSSNAISDVKSDLKTGFSDMKSGISDAAETTKNKAVKIEETIKKTINGGNEETFPSRDVSTGSVSGDLD